MCGIIGYVGGRNAKEVLLSGLKTLEYRGYDSSGMYISGTGIIKAIGKVHNLKEKLLHVNGHSGIAHTRWATHGVPSEANAHPHSGSKGRVWIVHNGIIENYQDLKNNLIKEGDSFVSETDSEVVAHLLENEVEKGKPLVDAFFTIRSLLRGSYAFSMIDTESPDTVVVARRGSPLLVGVGQGEYIIASDISALLPYTKKVVYLDEGDVAVIDKDTFALFDVHNKKKLHKEVVLSAEISQLSKNGYKHFMLKEIMEQPDVIRRALLGRISAQEVNDSELDSVRQQIVQMDRCIVTGCGTAFYSGLLGSYMLEEYIHIPVHAEVASEWRYRHPVMDNKTCFIVLSQSGETADTLEALREAKKQGAFTIGIVNVENSTISREVDICLYTRSGPEIGVASTKAFTSQSAVFAWFMLACAQIRTCEVKDRAEIISSLCALPEKIYSVIEQTDFLRNIARDYASKEHFLYIGRKYQFPIALEGALKLKEISYIHAEGYGSGEMKHGPLAMIDDAFPTCALALKDSMYEKNISNILEIKARKGKILAIATLGDAKIADIADTVVYIPESHEMSAPIISAVALQLFAYHVADIKKLDIDKPRNLAKAVTVE